MKKKRHIGVVILPVILIISLILPQMSYLPVTTIAKIGFQSGAPYTKHPAYEERKTWIKEQLDLSYPSSYSSNTYDIYHPQAEGHYPLLVWVHGGGFVGGDKMDNRTYMEMIASYGYCVVSMNYALAPEHHYPIPILQISELFEELKRKQDVYPMNLNQIFIGGDSAGAQLAAQFTTIQTNEEYQKLTGFPPVISPNQIKGFLSFCGLLDVHAFDETDSTFSNFLYGQCAWAYFDTKDWKTSEYLKQADFLPWINEAFPAAFLTDGDLNSFLKPMHTMKAHCESYQVPVTAITYGNNANLPHEYQFELQRNEALKTFDQVISFLSKHK